jgi:hypothetical protein
MRGSMVSLVAAILLTGAVCVEAADSSPPAEENAKADGTVTLKGGSVAAGIGYTWGHGELNYQGAHAFTIKGVSVVDVGAEGFNATGNVYHLSKLSDFTGNYVAFAAGIAVAGGGTATYLKNEHGVVIRLLAKDVGLKFNLSADGVHVALKK